MILNPYRFAALAVPAPLHWWNLTSNTAEGLWDYGSGDFGLLATSSTGVTVEADQPDGVGDCIEFDNSGTPDGYVFPLQDKAWDGAGNDISISCWIAFPTGSAYVNRPFFSWYNSSPDDRLVRLEVNVTADAWQAVFYDTGTKNVTATDLNADPVPDGRWYHFIATYNGSTDTASLYVDNTLTDSATNAAMGALEDQPMPLVIGARGDVPTTTGVDARMFSCAIFDKVLDADERTALYNGGNGGTYADFFGTPSIGTNPTTTDLFAWWKLEDVTDAHTGSINLTNNNTTTFTAGYEGNAATLNGTNQYLSATATSVFPTGAQTWACFCKMDTARQQDIMAWLGAPGQRSLNIVQQSSGIIQSNASGDGSTLINAISTLTVPAGTWVHVAVVYVPSISLTLYINAEQAAQETVNVPSSLHNSTTDFAIGARAVPDRYFDGQIDDACIFEKALSVDEIKWLVHNTYADLT
jgi:hypothetical protein